ncbi:MAG: FAD-dependent oxidoreductase, partial [Candidatus Heimdallarchaeota archaeon]|nr:FAD-dependent oxidoreductase [Candidatus Heimdallarchaeota archaeon]
MNKPVLVVGAGIAGIQSSLDLAQAGVSVILIDKKSSIGGTMAALDKNFPTLDCSICIEAPKMSDVLQNLDIDVKTQTELIGIEGLVGNFKAKVKETTRYVTSECTRCDECSKVCPQIVPNEFDHGMGYRKAIYSAFQQAEPGTYSVNIEDCLNNPPNYIPCNRCVDACLPKCIDFNLLPYKEYEIEVSSIIIATGFEAFNPNLIPEYNYSEHPDILTSMEFERMLNSAGPTSGHIIKPSNHLEPKNILFVLCVGSRDQRYCSYCSRVCCMYSIKEAYQALDHGIKDVTVLYMDIRAYGKDFDEFYDRTVKKGVKFIRGRPANIEIINYAPFVTYENTETSEVITEKYDLVVLATAMLPSRGNISISNILGVELDEYGFIMTQDINGLPVGTSVSGIYVCGCASGPKDIPDSVADASAAAAAAMIHVSERNWTIEHYEETINPNGKEKIGVFVCDCGSNIAGVVDVPDVVSYVKELDGVDYAEEVMFACSGSTQNKISDTIKKHGLNRLVVAACSPKTHSNSFQRACAKAGLNKYMFEMSNIRNHNSWVHKELPVLATEKAKDMIRMSIEKSRFLTPLNETILPVTQKAMVIGSGVAGLAASWNLAKQGFETHLIEKSDKLGGMLNNLTNISPTGESAIKIKEKMITDTINSGVIIHTNTTVSTISGAVGNYQVMLSNQEKYIVGAIVLAYGATPYESELYKMELKMKIISNLDLDKSLYNRIEENITFIGCVGSRISDNGCSRYCCTNMIYQAIHLKELGKNVTIVYKDIRTYTQKAEELYYQAALKGVAFIQISQDIDPESDLVIANDEIIVFDELLGESIAIPTDLLVLVVGINPPIEHLTADMLKVSKTTNNFLLELHPKLAPVEAAVQGVYMAGSVRGPVAIDEAISQGLAAASKASNLLSKNTVSREPLMAYIDPNLCNGCTRCTKVCPYNAIMGDKKKIHNVIEAACMGCGTCAAECAQSAIT